ncbi:OmpO family porin [Cognatilysobacter tabacisoli]|jgi:Ax21 family sulfation-dependent quorum factor|uniref:OmpO family porin n=1 Tax=Cognatilysobacter tabacisoli TaxID=2315424 RepID=UPI000E6B121F|nr:Ax21 family protein [Lysobacter tabacisoli]
MKRSLLALTLMAALPFAASAAEGVSYTYVEGGYAATNTDAGDADGFAINGSGAIAPNFHVFGGYSNQEIEDTDIDFDQWKVGLGYNHQIAPNADLVTRVAYEKFDAGSDIFGNDLEADGYSVEAGVRGALTPNFEGYAFAGYEDGDDLDGASRDGEFYGRLGAQVKFNQTWGVNGDVKFVDGDTQWFVGPRLSW